VSGGARPGVSGVANRLIDGVIDRGALPDPVLRATIRALLRRRLAATDPGTPEGRARAKAERLAAWRHAPVALSTDEANEQHYEVPTELFELMLGPRLKYSSAYWPAGVTSLAQAEDAMLALTGERAALADGQDILELGCGWGSLTLWMAERYPNARIIAVSNSATQRAFIEKRAVERDLANVTVITCDVNDFGVAGPRDDTLAAVAGGFDRVVSVEMFEHVRNHAELLRRVSTWLRQDGSLFVHVFAHRELLYPFDVAGGADWMARHFFTDGVMPSHDLFLHLQEDLVVDGLWAVDGTHYSRTLEAWLQRLDTARPRALQLLADTYGADRAEAWYHRWRVFNLACSELFAFRGGTEWHVTHVRMSPR
jgi:cyclopropane-fatty-acyl-phospholipid synthase